MSRMAAKATHPRPARLVVVTVIACSFQGFPAR
jgi:hypothetical protein